MMLFGLTFRQEVTMTQPPKLLDQVRHTWRTKHYFLRTEEAYLHRIKRYIFFNNLRRPAEMNSPEIELFLTYFPLS
jgi:hypothetical protein